MVGSKKFWIKEDWMVLLPLLIFVIAFNIHYFMVMGYHENLFEYHEYAVKEGIFQVQKEVFKINLIGNGILLIFIIIATSLTLNIGFIFLGYKLKFKEICIMVLKASTVVSLVYLALPIIMFFKTEIYTFDYLYNLEFEYTLARFLPDFSPVWLRNLLESFSICQIFYISILALGVKSLMNWNIEKSLLTVLKVYGFGFLIWHSFALIMDVNFHQ